MSRLWLILLIMAVLAGCGAQPTATPTSAPSPTETQVPPTETIVPPTETSVPTSVPPTSTPTEIPVTGTVKATLNVRESPSLNAKLLGVLNKGDSIVLKGTTQDKKWLQVNYPLESTSTGWVVSSLVETAGAIDTLPILAAQVATTAPTSEATKVASASTATPTETVTKSAGTETLTATIQATNATVTATVPATLAPSATPAPTIPPGLESGAPSGSIIFDTFEKNVFQINQVRADGTGLKLLFTGASEPALSPDGARLAYHKRNGPGGAGIAISSLSGSDEQIVVSAANAEYPTWSSDGQNIAYDVPQSAGLPAQLFWSVAQRGFQPTLIGLGRRPAWQPGGSRLVLFDGCDGNGSNCYSLHLANAFEPDVNNPTLITHGTNGAWSPNGQQVAFQDTDESGNINVFVANRDGSGKRQVTKGTGHDGVPIWSSDGQWLYYRSDQNGTSWAIYAIRVDGTGARKIVDAPVNSDQWDFEKIAIAP